MLKLSSEKCNLLREIDHAKSDLLEHETVQRLNQSKIEFATESVAILGEEVVHLQEILETKKGEGETIYTDMRDHLST